MLPKPKYKEEKRLKKRLEAECDKAWKKLVIKKYGSRCNVCKGEGVIQPHHFFPKRNYYLLKFVVENGVPLCKACHFRHHHLNDPTIHQGIIAGRGKEWYNKLVEKSKEQKYSFKTLDYYDKTLRGLKRKLK